MPRPIRSEYAAFVTLRDSRDPEAIARQRAAIARGDAMRARKAAAERTARRVYCAVVVVVGLALFYGASGDVLTLAGFMPR